MPSYFNLVYCLVKNLNILGNPFYALSKIGTGFKSFLKNTMTGISNADIS